MQIKQEFNKFQPFPSRVPSLTDKNYVNNQMSSNRYIFSSVFNQKAEIQHLFLNEIKQFQFNNYFQTFVI